LRKKGATLKRKSGNGQTGGLGQPIVSWCKGPDNVNYPPGVIQCTRQLRYDSGDMKRWSLVILGLIVVTLSAFTVHHVRQKRAQQKREANYQSALRSYSEVLKPGMTRNDVEGYLKAKNVKFTQMCCVAQHTGAFDDLTKIGQEDAPWYCSEQNIYVAFQFTAAERYKTPRTHASDTLRAITIFPWLEGCL